MPTPDWTDADAEDVANDGEDDRDLSSLPPLPALTFGTGPLIAPASAAVTTSPFARDNPPSPPANDDALKPRSRSFAMS